jgi:hypothetical protein
MTSPVPAPSPTLSQRFRAGGWYFVLTIASAGLFAAIPFWHAAARLKEATTLRLAVIYTLADVALIVLAALTPPRRPDGASGNQAISTIGGFLALAVIVAACLQLRSVRRQVYGGHGVVPLAGDPAVARALAARTRRQEARELLERDPGLARELGIGRPDLHRDYDDGGLVDINNVPAAVIAQTCGFERSYADAIVAAREARGGTFYNVGEVLVDVNLPPSVQELLSERAVV